MSASLHRPGQLPGRHGRHLVGDEIVAHRGRGGDAADDEFVGAVESGLGRSVWRMSHLLAPITARARDLKHTFGQ